jgi:hypothetical protein
MHAVARLEPPDNVKAHVDAVVTPAQRPRIPASVAAGQRAARESLIAA